MTKRSSTEKSIRLHPRDNVAVLVAAVGDGEDVNGVRSLSRIPRGHKMATSAIKSGSPVVKFGQIIGFASRDIMPGEWVHEHNLAMGEFDRSPHQVLRDQRIADSLPASSEQTFAGFRRADGRVGTRNYLAILTSVNCSASVARFIARDVESSGVLSSFPNVDGVIPLVHGSGCAMDSRGVGYEVLKRTQFGYAMNPNIAGVLMIGLGCEVFQIGPWKEAYGLTESETFRTLIIQEIGGTKKAVEAGVEAFTGMLPLADAARRTMVPVAELTLALQCGGSDGYSGITANPALGAAVDLLIGHGGAAILSETPEIYQHDEIGLYAYATLGSLDATMWQNNERKARYLPRRSLATPAFAG